MQSNNPSWSPSQVPSKAFPRFPIIEEFLSLGSIFEQSGPKFESIDDSSIKLSSSESQLKSFGEWTWLLLSSQSRLYLTPSLSLSAPQGEVS